MDNFNWTQFSKRIYIHTSVKQAYDYWTIGSNIEKWFLAKATFTKMDDSPVVPTENISGNCNYEWQWFAQDHSEKGKITNTNGADLIEFTFAGNCIVIVKLTEVKKQVLVELTQTEIPTDNSSKEKIRLGCSFGWSFYLLNLKSVLEGVIDLRNKDTALVNVVNN